MHGGDEQSMGFEFRDFLKPKFGDFYIICMLIKLPLVLVNLLGKSQYMFVDSMIANYSRLSI